MPLNDAHLATEECADLLLALDGALVRLKELDARQTNVVDAASSAA